MTRIYHYLILGFACSTAGLSACQSVKSGAHVATYPIRAVDTAIRSEPVEELTTTTPATHVETAAKAQNFGDAAMSPLSDVNIRRPDIPEVLLNIDSPYAPLNTPDCDHIKTELESLDAVLGPDMDSPEADASSQKNRFFSKATSISVVESTAGSIIPFRSLVRLASGASARDKNIQRYYRKGVARRGYLRGVHAAQNCDMSRMEVTLHSHIPYPTLKTKPLGTDDPTSSKARHSRP